MTQYLNPHIRSGITPNEAGALYIDRQVTQLNDLAVIPAGTVFAIGDQLQIGVIPAGAVLLPELSTLNLPIVDTNGAPTAHGSIGTAASATQIAAAQALGAAVTLRGSSLALSAQPGASLGLGSPDTDTPIYLTFTALVATLAPTGQFVLDLALRAFNPDFDPNDDA